MALAKHQLVPDEGASAQGAAIATVTTAEAGLAYTLSATDGATAIPVYAHLDAVSRLHVGDRVCYMPSAQGAVVVGRLRGSDETPAARLRDENGELEIAAGQSITLQAGASRIQLNADGRLRVVGREIEQTAACRFSLMGAVLELN